MKLRIAHRFLLSNLLPEENNIGTLRVIRELQSALSFSEKELKEKFIRRDGDIYTWGDPENEDKDAAAEAVDEPVDILVGERAFDIIKDSLNYANDMGKLRMQFIPLYEHFCEGKEWKP